MNNDIKPRTEAEEIVDLMRQLPDHYRLMRISKMGGEEWRIYDNAGALVESDYDLLTVLNLLLT